jgi:hypothetical protein
MLFGISNHAPKGKIITLPEITEYSSFSDRHAQPYLFISIFKPLTQDLLTPSDHFFLKSNLTKFH